ncbi:MAG: amidohydrolase family protein [Acidobacteriota bacterium]
MRRAALAIALAWWPAFAATTAITGARVLVGDGRVIDSGTVLIVDGKIAEVGSGIAIPADAAKVDGTGKTLTPAIFDADTTVGIEEVSLVPATVDVDEEAGPVMPQLRTLDAYNPGSEVIEITRAGGVTIVAVNPGAGNVVSGRSAVMRLDPGLSAADAAMLEPAALHVNMGEPPKGKFGGRKEMPSTRMGIAAVIRDAFEKAGEYRGKVKAYEKKKQGKEGDKAEPPDFDPKSEALLAALDGKIPVVFRANRADDILTALRLAKEIGVRPILLGGAEAWKVASDLVASKTPVIYSPAGLQPDAMDRLDAVEDGAARLQNAGVLLVLATGDAHNARNLPVIAGRAVAFGLPYDAAIAAITKNPAKVYGLDDRLGTVEKGKLARLVLWSGDPLESSTRVERVISGNDVSEPSTVLERNGEPYLKR